MSFPPHVWSRLKNTTAQDLIKALERDGWIREERRGAVQAFRKENGGKTIRRVTVHYHPKKTYGAKFLKGLIRDIGWSHQELKNLKLI